jgi:hypothetical protein
MYRCKECQAEVKIVMVPDVTGNGLHETSECPCCGEDAPYEEADDTVGATFHLMGRFELPGNATPVDGGFKLPNGRTYRIQAVLEEESEDGETHTEPGTCDLEALGIVGFGELDEREFRIED